MSKRRILVLGLACAVVAAFVFSDLNQLLRLEVLKARHGELAVLHAANPVAVVAGYFLLYVAVAALSLPGATILTLAGGAVFGLVTGTVVVSFASTVGATLAFLVARYLFRAAVERRFATRMAEIDRGIAREGAYYLLSLRLVPLFPFFLVNLLMGLTRLRAGTYYLVSQLGMLPATILYVNAGTRLASLESARGILSLPVLGSLLLLALFSPLAARLVGALRTRRIYAPWAHARPRHFERNLVVIGAGSAGLVTSYIAAAVRARVTLIEAEKMGGDCLNTGCVPSKALLRAAGALQEIRRAADFGIVDATGRFDFAAGMARVREVIRTIEPHDSIARYTALGVECLQGHARLRDPWRVEITRQDGQRQILSTRAIVLATGAEPVIPELPGLAAADPLTSETVWALTALPPRMLVLGAGPIGCELAQCFARLGSTVTLVERDSRMLPREDPEAVAEVREALQREGVTVLCGQEALQCVPQADAWALVTRDAQGERELVFDRLLCATGRRPRLGGLGLEELGLLVDGRLEADEFLRTRYPNILAAGDLVGPYQFTHAAAHQAWYAAVNGLFGGLRRFRADYSALPRILFTDPEIAQVGHTEASARAAGVAFEVTRYGLEDLDRAIADGSAEGFVKVLTVPGRDRILGVTIVGRHAGEMLPEFVLALRHGLGLKKILGTVHAYPSFAEGNKYAAGAWQRAHAPQRLLRWLARYHAWRRG